MVSPSAVGLGEKWNGRIVFGDVMQSERGLFAMFVAIKNGVKTRGFLYRKFHVIMWNIPAPMDHHLNVVGWFACPNDL